MKRRTFFACLATAVYSAAMAFLQRGHDEIPVAPQHEAAERAQTDEGWARRAQIIAELEAATRNAPRGYHIGIYLRRIAQ